MTTATRPKTTSTNGAKPADSLTASQFCHQLMVDSDGDVEAAMALGRRLLDSDPKLSKDFRDRGLYETLTTIRRTEGTRALGREPLQAPVADPNRMATKMAGARRYAHWTTTPFRKWLGAAGVYLGNATRADLQKQIEYLKALVLGNTAEIHLLEALGKKVKSGKTVQDVFQESEIVALATKS